MTTDITELAQSLKAAAEKATPGQWMRSSVQFNSITDIANPMEQGNKPHIANTSEKRDAEFIAMANPANILALVEALEKAQTENTAGAAGMAESYETTISMLRSRIAELEESHAQVIQSRDHYKRISEEGLKQLAESSTVTVKLPDDEDGQAYGFGKWANGKLPVTTGAMTISYCEDAWRAAFEVFSSVAGIKVEAE